MATGQSLLDRMELLNQELQLQSGESDVTRGLLALNVAQDYFESVAAVRKGLLGGAVGTVTTSASTETTSFPSGVLRIDRMQLLNSSSRPKRRLLNLKEEGEHAQTSAWPINLIESASDGEPYAYWTNGTNIYWAPRPDAIYTIRYYGFSAASDITAGGTFAYPDICMLPFATFAVRLLKSGLDDPTQDYTSLASATFDATLEALERFNRDGAAGLVYTQNHTE